MVWSCRHHSMALGNDIGCGDRRLARGAFMVDLLVHLSMCQNIRQLNTILVILYL